MLLRKTRKRGKKKKKKAPAVASAKELFPSALLYFSEKCATTDMFPLALDFASLKGSFPSKEIICLGTCTPTEVLQCSTRLNTWKCKASEILLHIYFIYGKKKN